MGVGAEGLRGGIGGEGEPRPRPPWCATAAGHRVPPCPSRLASPLPHQCLSGYPRLALLRGVQSLAVRTRAATPAPAQASHSAAFSATASTCRCGWGDPKALGPLFWLLKALYQDSEPSLLPRFSVFLIKFYPVPRFVPNLQNGVYGAWEAKSPSTHIAPIRACADASDRSTKSGWPLARDSGRLSGFASLLVGLPGAIGHLASFQETGFKPIRGEFALLGGGSLVGNSKPVLLSTLAIVAVSQGRGSNLLQSLSGRALVVWESGRGAAVDWSPAKTSDPILLARSPEGDADW